MDTSSNVAFSPVSIGHNLAVLLNGSSGKSRDELLALFSLTESNKDGFNESQRALLNQLNSVEGRPMKTAAAVFLVQPVIIDKGFSEKMGKNYEAVVRKLGGATIEGKRLINEWVSERTDGEIPELVTTLSKEEAVYVVNVVHFQGKWAKPFDKDLTARKSFTTPQGSKTAAMMSQSESFAYYEDEDMQAVRLGYTGSDFAMVAMLPRAGTTIDALQGKLDATKWKRVHRGLDSARGLVVLPKFSFETDCDLMPIVKNLGVPSLFNNDCNFRNMSIEMESGYFVSVMRHKAVIKVDEEGTKASAATATGISPGIPGGPFEFIADRPFIYAIVEMKTGAICFLGVVNDPTKG